MHPPTSSSSSLQQQQQQPQQHHPPAEHHRTSLVVGAIPSSTVTGMMNDRSTATTTTTATTTVSGNAYNNTTTADYTSITTNTETDNYNNNNNNGSRNPLLQSPVQQSTLQQQQQQQLLDLEHAHSVVPPPPIQQQHQARQPTTTTTAVASAVSTASTSLHNNNNQNHSSTMQQQQQHQQTPIQQQTQQQPPSTASTTTTTPLPPNISYSAERIIGNGSFGVVFEAKVVETGDIVAIKKVLQDKRFKNRELQIMRQLVKDPHPNIVQLQHCFYSQGEKPDELYLNLVLEFVPETVYSISRRHQKHSIPLPLMYVKLYMYQLCRALAHIHCLGICHRDIKPQNLLVHPVTQQLKLCDFGSAKALIPGEPNVSYICSRYYRAPELIFGSTDYTTAIDIWSQGCVGAELLLGQPLFPGDSGVDQLVEIIKVLGTPTKEEIRSMNSNYMEFKFPQIKGCQWKKIFRNKTPDDAVSFIAANLAYTPSKRIRPLEACTHAFFDELRIESTMLPNNGGPLPPLFNFTTHELQHAELMHQLLPDHLKHLYFIGTNITTMNSATVSYSTATSTTTSTSASPLQQQQKNDDTDTQDVIMNVQQQPYDVDILSSATTDMTDVGDQKMSAR